jgi:hypothetical protein
MADRRVLDILFIWVSVMFLTAAFTRRVLNLLSGGRTVVGGGVVMCFRLVSSGAFLAGLYYMWKLR